ncbi:MAG: HAMP domain-containing protein [Candidatus Latescibacteria bacterium]|nr:HAMP domain-containing protein [Candidatus Latescibacterota bacterium]
MAKHRIFIRIYLWFWLAMAVIIVSHGTIDRITQSGPMIDHIKHVDGNSLTLFGHAAVDMYEREDVNSLENLLNRLKKTTGIHIFLFDSENNELLDQVRSDEVDNITEIATKSGNTELVFSGNMHFVALSIGSSRGNRYIIAGEYPHPPHGDGINNLSSFLLHQLFAILVSGAICYWLALYFSSPIVKLGNAVRQFAAGNLSVRVGPAMGKRKDEISALAFAFDRMADRIESLLTAQRNLLRDVSHELRSPLARLKVALELCRQKCNPESMKSLGRIENEADKLNEMIGQILVMNLTETGTSVIEKAEVDLAKLIRDIVDDANFEANNMDRSVEILMCEECTLSGNEELLRRAVENIVRNAILYTAEGSVVEISLSYVRNKNNNNISITVRDYGPGVPEKEIEHLFEPFYRVGDDRDRQSGGTGIGLAITRAAVELHGGKVTASNAPGVGLCVEVKLPAA